MEQDYLKVTGWTIADGTGVAMGVQVPTLVRRFLYDNNQIN